MPLQEILEVAIGLIFAWLVLSVATMQVQEWIASYFGWRAKDMEAAIRNMLGDVGWAEQLYQHPIIQGLSQKTGVKPSYIPANQFAVALFDVVMTAGTDGSVLQRELLTLKAQKPKSLAEFLRLGWARWWDQIKTWVIRWNNYLTAKDTQTATMRYETLLEYASKADSSPSELEKLLTALTQTDTIQKISSLYPELTPALDKFYSKIPAIYAEAREKLAALPASNKNVNQEILSKLLEDLDQKFSTKNIPAGLQAILTDKNNLELLKILFSINYPSENTLDKLANNLQGIVDTNPLLHKAINTLKPDLKDFAKKVDGLDEKAVAFLKEKETHLLETRAEAETWFNDVMARTQGWYKRRAQAWSFIIGLCLALLLNVDTVALSNLLWREPVIRQSFVATADKFITETNDIDTLTEAGLSPEQAMAQFQKRFEGIKVPFGWDLIAHPEKTNCRLFASPEQIVGFYLPFTDYDPSAAGRQAICLEIGDPPRDIPQILAKLLGILISALAAMQGAPFWFDILKKLVNVRGTGANPAEKPHDEKISAMRQIN